MVLHSNPHLWNANDRLLSIRLSRKLDDKYSKCNLKHTFNDDSGKLGERSLNIPMLSGDILDWLQSLKQFFINVSYHILVASLTMMALFQNRAIRVRLATSI